MSTANDMKIMTNDVPDQQELDMVRVITNSLFNIMRPLYRNFPDDYVVVDIETTGFNRYSGKKPFFDGSFITQLGYCIVKDGDAVQQDGLILNWYDVAEVVKSDLTEALINTKRNVEIGEDGQPTGKTYHMTPALMKTGGDPVEVMTVFRQLLEDTINNKLFFVMHNGFNFDVPRINDHFRYWLKKPLVFGDNILCDTGMIEKGSRLAETPWIGDTVRSWSRRLGGKWAKGIKWSLDGTCVKRYRLAEKHFLNMDEAHDAGFDCYVTHLLFKEFIEIASGRRRAPPALK